MKSVKKLFATLLMVCATPALFACDAYIGGAVGIGSFDGAYRGHDQTTDERHYSRNGGLSFIGGGQIGVEDYFENCWCDCLDDLYGALEFNFLYNSYNKTVRSSTVDGGSALEDGVRLKNDFLFGIDVKWGTRICNATPYIVTGYALGSWDFKLLNRSGATELGVPDGGTRTKKTKSGFKLGTGVRYDVCDCTFFDLQYSYTWFENIHRTLVSTDTWKHKVDLNQQRIVFAFNWTFGSY